MKKGDILEGRVERIDFPNIGIINVDGTGVVVKNAIPGQLVRFQINKKRHGRCEGRLLEVIEKSQLELDVCNCPHYPGCGGCLYQCLAYEDQLKIKEKQIKDLLDTVCQDYEFQGIKASPISDGFRNKMEFTFGDEYKDGPLALGQHKRNSFYDIITVTGCKIIDEDYRKILKATVDFFKETDLPYYRRMQHIGYLRHLVVRKAVKTKEILVNIVTTSQVNYDMKQYKDMLLGLELDGSFAGILHTINDSLADTVQADSMELLYGKNYFYEELLGLRFKISPFSFFQTNSLGAEVLYSAAREFIMESYYGGDSAEMRGATVFDLYSGTGTIAQMIAPACGHVIGVEIVEEAVEAAKENARLNGLENCDFIAGDVLKVLDDIEEKPDYIILDPPREGIHPKALEKILSYGVDNMVYISCKPTSLVRDLEICKARGYKVVKACCVDMFPAAAHCETICLLSRANTDK